MIKEAMQYLRATAHGARDFASDGREYTTMPIHFMPPQMPAAVKVVSLTGLVDFLRFDVDGLKVEEWFLHVLSPISVGLFSKLNPPWQERKELVLANFAGATKFPFGRFLPQEEMVVGIQTGFVQEGTEGLLRLVGNLKDEAVTTQVDDGVGQTVTVRRGAATVETTVAQSRWTLKPYRTWPELEQPSLECILRINKGPSIALFPIEDPGWSLRAMQAAADYLRSKVEVKVIA